MKADDRLTAVDLLFDCGACSLVVSGMMLMVRLPSFSPLTRRIVAAVMEGGR